MEMLDLVLRSHALTHGLEVGESEGRFSLEYGRLRELSEDQLRIRPNGWNSIAWLLWHIARTEDVAVNVVVADRPQVLDAGDWNARLRISRRDVGTGMTDDEVEALSAAIDIPGLLSYRRAVGLGTREVAAALPPDAWDDVAGSGALSRAVRQDAFGPSGEWIAKFWEGKSNAWFFYWVAVGHNIMHLSQAGWVKEMILSRRGR
jgi:hypothetical protein